MGAIERLRDQMSAREAALAELQDAIDARDASHYMHLVAELERFDGVPCGTYKHGVKRPASRHLVGARKTGAPRLEMRDDWEDKIALVARVDAWISKGCSQERACELEDISPRTYRRHKERSKGQKGKQYIMPTHSV
ncbi:MAG TPA: hypothetical protein VMV87_03440 [Burkholderiales bacterium]|nr:hypothetical protein [Burkholderiales bacterium]